MCEKWRTSRFCPLFPLASRNGLCIVRLLVGVSVLLPPVGSLPMIAKSDLKRIARARLQDAQVLLGAKRYDGAVYLCGYAIETALKARICRTLHWPQYPSTRADFQHKLTFRTHDLDLLLELSGIESKVKSQHLADWSIVVQWEPEMRYRPVGSANATDATNMLQATKALFRVL